MVLGRSYSQGVQEVQGFIEKNEQKIQLGPAFKVRRGDRKPLEVRTMTNGDASYVVGLVDGQIVGRREFHTTKSAPKEREVEGHVYMSDTVRGYGIQLEAAFQFWLQRLADQDQVMIRHVVDNQNVRDAEGLAEEFLSQEDLSNLYREQGRWQSMWGKNGKLGYRKPFLQNRLIKEFKPGQSTPLAGYQEIALDCEEEKVKGRTLVSARQAEVQQISESIELQNNPSVKQELIQAISATIGST